MYGRTLISQFFGQGTGTTSVTVAIPDGPINTPLVVIDNILAGCVSGTANAPLTVTVGGVVIARRNMPTLTSDFYQLEWAAGFPQWSAAATDVAPATGVSVVLTAPALSSGATLTVTYHYASMAEVRN